MVTKLVDALADMGAEVTVLGSPDGSPDVLLEVYVEGVTCHLAVQRRARAPYPGEISTLLDRRGGNQGLGTPVLYVPYMPESTGRLLIPMGWSWADEQGNYDLALRTGLRFRNRDSAAPRRSTSVGRTLPQGSGGLAIIRFLISASPEVHVRTSDLANLAEITHARASQVLHRLREMALVTNESGWKADRDALLQRFLKEYRGPGGTELSLYSLDGPMEAVHELTAQVPGRGVDRPRLVVSADVGPDLVAPWRRPTAAVVYVDDEVRLDVSRLIEADPSSANVYIRYPADTSVFGVAPLVARNERGEVRLADPTQMISDLRALGGEDRYEAGERLSEWLLTRS